MTMELGFGSLLRVFWKAPQLTHGCVENSEMQMTLRSPKGTDIWMFAYKRLIKIRNGTVCIVIIFPKLDKCLAKA